MASVRKVNDVIREISSTVGQQSQGIGEVSAVLTPLDQMPQQSAAATERLRAQAGRLAPVVGGFRIHAPNDV